MKPFLATVKFVGWALFTYIVILILQIALNASLALLFRIPDHPLVYLLAFVLFLATPKLLP